MMKRICSVVTGVMVAAVLVVAQILSAHADVVDRAANGFQLKHTFHVSATPDKSYAALIRTQASS